MSCATYAAIIGAVSLLTKAPHSLGPLYSSDEIVYAPTETGAVICYHNHVDSVSAFNTWHLEIGGVPVSVQVHWSEGRQEVLRVTPPVGFAVSPEGEMHVEDGEVAVVEIVLPMF